MRSSISAQSWASVPPAPACSSQTASPLVELAGEQRLAPRGGRPGAARVVDRLRRARPPVPRRAPRRPPPRPPARRSTSASARSAGEPVEAGQVVGDPGELGGDRPGTLGVVPQVGPGGLGLELGPAGPQLADPQVLLGLAQPGGQVVQLGGQVTGLAGARRLRGSHGRACTSCRSRTSTGRCAPPSRCGALTTGARVSAGSAGGRRRRPLPGPAPAAAGPAPAGRRPLGRRRGCGRPTSVPATPTPWSARTWPAMARVPATGSSAAS